MPLVIKRSPPLGALAIVLVLTLGALGIAYGLWAQSLIVNATVSTGELDWGLASFTIQDDDPPPPVYPTTKPDMTCSVGFVDVPGWPGGFWRYLDKNVGWGEGLLVDTDGDGDNDVLQLTLHNVYPSYCNEIALYPVNTGTIPLKIQDVTFNPGNIVLKQNAIVRLDLNGDGQDDVEICYGDNFGAQLHPGGPRPEISFWVHVLQAAPQGQTLTFSISIRGVQWNEYQP